MSTITPASQSIGQKLDAELAAIKKGTSTVETEVVSAASKIGTWVRNNAVHIAGYSGIIAVLKHFV